MPHRAGAIEPWEVFIIRYLLLESPLLLIPVLIVGQYILTVVWLRRRTRRSKRVMLVGLTLCIVLPAIQMLVVTDRERIRVVCQAMVEATEAGNIEAIGEYVALNFDVRGIDRDAFLDGVGKALNHTHIENASLSRVEIEAAGNRATAHFNVRCRLIMPQDTEHVPLSAWTAVFEWRNGQWRMTGIDPRRTPFFPFSHLEELIR